MLPQTQKSKTISEKVTELILHKNKDEYGGSSSESTDEATIAKSQFDEYELPDARSTEIRKKNIKLLSEQSAKYKGKISSRKDFEKDYNEEEENDSTDSNSDYEYGDSSKKSKEFSMKLKDYSLHDNIRNQGYNSGEIGNSDSDEENEDDDDSDISETSDIEENIQETDIVGETNRHAEIQKGECVKNQLNLWEKLLEIRIHAQKLLSKANLLPQPENLQNEQMENADVMRTTRQTQENCANLLNHLLQLQNSLYNQFSEIKTSCPTGRHKRSLPFVDNKSEAPTSKRFAQHLEQRFNDFKPYRNSILLKWDDRTKLLTPGAGSKKKTQQEEYDILKKIENAMLNRKMVVDKPQILVSQVKNAVYAETNYSAESNESGSKSVTKSHVYDDTDFYHQQLRELIEYKSSGSANASDVTKQLIELQKLRQKMKKKVDTRASKGRKIRYNVHKKLINFMAPHDASSWTEESKNELCKSLFFS